MPITSLVLVAALAAGQGDSPADRRAALLRERAAIDAELRALDAQAAAPATPATTSGAANQQRALADDVVVTGRALSLTTDVRGQTVTTVRDAVFRNTPATTIADIVRLSPGVVVS